MKTCRGSKAASLAEIERYQFVLTPGRYVGVEENGEEDAEPFEERMERLTSELREQMRASEEMDHAIRDGLRAVGYAL